MDKEKFNTIWVTEKKKKKEKSTNDSLLWDKWRNWNMDYFRWPSRIHSG